MVLEVSTVITFGEEEELVIGSGHEKSYAILVRLYFLMGKFTL